MIYLIVSIVCNVTIVVLLKIVRKQKIDVHQAVVVNYVAAIMLTMLVPKPDLGNLCAFLPTWWLFVALGVPLPFVLITMDKSVDTAGIVKSDAAQRLSLFLPIIASSALFDEKLTEGRLIGITLALAALLCLLWKSGGGKKLGGLMNNAALLLGAWSGYGVIDILFEQVAKSGMTFPDNLLVVLSLAAVLMFGCLSYRLIKWTKGGIIGGTVLSCLNFADILTYICTHQIMSENPMLVLTGMNIGVIVLGTLVGAAAFKEKISSTNAADISVAVCSVTCLFYWPQLRSLTEL